MMDPSLVRHVEKFVLVGDIQEQLQNARTYRYREQEFKGKDIR